ncbi:MAG: class I SAM-dependent methyltransferase [Pseudomonas sp.]|uniref:class I SAM-dependent methyltransferase n=1 Tax=Pseudomonas sp. TaxID=306 RepID=UPI00239904E1|nr:class I SAM-dependent methyltransferase [Pseudomonas sp.]MDE1193805.1 class I SAM-dependent methyltransferase [Pseudomonas sp.]
MMGGACKCWWPPVPSPLGLSELCAERFYNLSPKVALLHIDGGHAGRNVLLDFLLYSPSVVPGGFIVFDDYGDYLHSPEVGPACHGLQATATSKALPPASRAATAMRASDSTDQLSL